MATFVHVSNVEQCVHRMQKAARYSVYCGSPQLYDCVSFRSGKQTRSSCKLMRRTLDAHDDLPLGYHYTPVAHDCLLVTNPNLSIFDQETTDAVCRTRHNHKIPDGFRASHVFAGQRGCVTLMMSLITDTKKKRSEGEETTHKLLVAVGGFSTVLVITRWCSYWQHSPSL